MRKKIWHLYQRAWDTWSRFWSASVTGRLTHRLSRGIARVFSHSRIGAWFHSKTNTQPFLHKLLTTLQEGAVGDFVRSSVFFKWMVEAPHVIWHLPLRVSGIYLLCLSLSLLTTGKWYFALVLLPALCMTICRGSLYTTLKRSFLCRWVPSLLEVSSAPVASPAHRVYLGMALLGALVGCSHFIIGAKWAILLAGALWLLPFLLASPFTCLLLTAWSAMCLPTLLVMLLSLLTFVVTLIHWLMHRRPLPPMSNAHVFWLLLMGITLLYTFIGYGGVNGILAGGIRLSMMPMLFCAWLLFSDANRLVNACKALSVGAAVIGVYGIWQYLTGGASAQWTDTELFGRYFGRIVATFENPNVYATFLVLFLPITVALLFGCKKGWEKCLYAGIALLLAINLALTYSRGCYIALALAALIMLWYIDKRWMGLVVIILLLCPLYLPDSIMVRLQSIGNLSDTSTTFRIQIWSGTLLMLKSYWWVGLGFGSVAFASVYDRFALDLVNAPHAHNLILQTLCESGILGLICTLGLVAGVFRHGLSTVHKLVDRRLYFIQAGLISAWAGLFFQGFFDYIFYNNNLFLLMMLSMGAMLAITNKGEAQKNEIKQ